jgi:hypothetical protein
MKIKIILFVITLLPFFGISQINQEKKIDSLIQEIHKEIIEIKKNQSNLITTKDFDDFKKQNVKVDKSDLKAKIEILESDTSKLQKSIYDLTKNLTNIRTSEKELNSKINILENTNKDLTTKANDLDDFTENYRKYLKSSSMLDTNFTTQIYLLKSANNFVELKTETDEFLKIQQKLSGIENKLKKNDFTEFNELKSELTKVSINASFNGLKARKEILEKDLEKVKMLFGFISKEIKEIQKLNLGQTNFNSEFFSNIESFKLSYKQLFDKYPFIYYQIDEVMKNQKHVLPVIN